ncbi:sensor histidine kinase KdpD [Microlunatus panaciterrae]|uniref:histidine kinase n=1 Tax=Microlunatus panaciterrae TaxID=400768 RepID=A0ABS2RHU1_9ACTN|nr:DUF4118 domain-containing protein [Microlunatus panaciterrae]MBM7798568.1 two-component system sensor histidine kinase KdpD [Microlunatus panaciterrae]
MQRGSLRIYLGAAPGVGKTFDMLSEGHRRASRGTDVVIGYVEAHGRKLTEALIAGLEVVPRRRLAYRGSTFEEMDLDAVIRRAPDVALVDELAHTNVPGVQHEKRWQDVEKLLAAGIDVISTVNIQHLESLNDVVNEITGVKQRETIPDEVVRRADQIELVDMSPQALRRRLAHGNVYAAEKIDPALGNYFRVGNLTALRELALLWLADRVDDALQSYRNEHGIAQPWAARERVVVALTGGPEGETLLRRGARIAGRGAGGELLAVHVGREDGLVDGNPGTLEAQRLLTERLGGSFHRIVGDDIAASIIDFAVGSNASLIVVGVSRKPRWQALFSESVGDGVVRGAGAVESLDVHVVAHEQAGRGLLPRRIELLSRRRRLVGWLTSVLGPTLLTAFLITFGHGLGLPTDLMLFLALTVAVALLGGLGPALTAAVLGSVLANFFLTPPLHTLTIADPEHALALLTSVLTGVAVASVVDRAARRADQARRASNDAEILSVLAGSVVRGEDSVAAILEQLRATFRMDSATLLERDAEDAAWRIVHCAGEPPCGRPEDADNEVTISPFLVLGLRGHALEGGSRRVLEAFAAQASAVLERERLRVRAEEARTLKEGDDIKTALLAAVSHDLRTPLANIKASITSLRQEDVQWSPADEKALLGTIGEATDRLERLVDNLLDLSRLQTGNTHPVIRAISLDEIILPALENVPADTVRLDFDEALPMIATDAGLVERALANIIENAVKHGAPSQAPVMISAAVVGETIEIRVVDRGPGIAASLREQMFEPFQRLGDGSAGAGLGLGLAVAKGFIDAVDGSVMAEDTPGGGLTVSVVLPLSSGVVRPGQGQRRQS